MSIKQNGGVFGRNPTFNDVTIEGDLIINGEVFTGLDFQGSWNASTNSPALASSVGTNGEFYIVSVAGTTDLNGITNWGIGDWAIFNGTAWQRVEGGADGNFNALTANSLNVNGTATMDDLTVNNNVGIGTSSPTQKLSLYTFRGYNADSALFSDVAINDTAVNNNAVHAWRTGMTGDAAGHDLTFSTLARTESTYQERLRLLATGIDVTGTVVADGLTVEATSDALIRISDSTSANQRLDLQHNGGVASLIAGNNGAYGTIKLQAYNGTDTVDRFKISANGDVDLGYEDTGTTPKLTWDASASTLDVIGSATMDGLTVDGTTVLNGNTTVNGALAHSSSGGLGVKIGLNNASIANSTDCYIGTHTTGGMGSTSGDMVLIPRSNANSAVQILTGNTTPTKTATFGYNGDISFYEDTGTTAKLTWKASDESLGIGTDSPNQALHISKGGQTGVRLTSTSFGADFGLLSSVSGQNGFGIYDYNASGYRFNIDSSGNVGIGTSSPQAPLDIASDTTSTLRLSNTDAVLVENQITGQVEFYQSDVSADATGITGKIGMRSAPMLGSNYYGNAADMDFYVSGQASGYASDNASLNAMTIQAGSGSVGIGTSSPASTLEIAKSDQTNGATVSITNSFDGGGWTAGDTVGTIDFRIDDSSSTEKVRGQIKVFDDTSSSTTYPAYSAMSFSTAYSATLNERMRISSDGSVGIGTSSPSASALLDVQSTTKGVRFPNMTTTQKNAMADVAGMQVYDTTLNKMCFNTGSAWETITSS